MESIIRSQQRSWWPPRVWSVLSGEKHTTSAKREREMSLLHTITAATGSICALAIASTATASSYGYTAFDVAKADLISSGYSDVTGGSPLVSLPGDCEGCVTFEYIDAIAGSSLAIKGFVEFQVVNPSFNQYMGLFAGLNFEFNDPNFTREDLYGVLTNGVPGAAAGESYDPGTPYYPEDAGPWWCPFTDFLPEYWDETSLFFNYFPDDEAAVAGDPWPGPVDPDRVFTFAWDFSDSTVFTGLEVVGVGTLPAPGALAVFGMVLVGGRRRRRN